MLCRANAKRKKNEEFSGNKRTIAASWVAIALTSDKMAVLLGEMGPLSIPAISLRGFHSVDDVSEAIIIKNNYSSRPYYLIL